MNTHSAHVHDKAGREYWDDAWAHQEFPVPIEPRGSSIWLHRDQVFHREIAGFMPRVEEPAVLELGCARSAWLPYFAREFGARVSGLDYSSLGARQAAEQLAREGIAGEIKCADLFKPPEEWLGRFDVVAWFGVAEHFEDAVGAIRAASAYLKPGGIVLTEIPNLAGVNGWLQRLMNRPVYDIHVPHTAPQLAAHHAAAGLEVLSSRYVVPTDFGVIELEGLPDDRSRRMKERILFPLRVLSGAVWLVDRRVGRLPTGRITGAFIFTVARKPAA